MPDQTPDQRGNILGGYRLDVTLGSGGMATVYRATSADGTVVALKVLDPDRNLPEEARRFQREYAALKGLDHPNVIRVYDTGEERSHAWISMEFVDGSDLGQLIEQWWTDPPTDLLERIETVFRGLCAGLQHIHGHDLVHRDLKPGNVLITASGVAKITDFGVVKDPTALTELTIVGKLVGTVAFMAPELILGEPVDQRTDLYGLGAILYNMLTGRRPVHADSVAGYLARHLSELPPRPSEITEETSPLLERICMRLLAKEPAQRYPDAASVIAALDGKDLEKTPTLHGRGPVLKDWRQRLLALREGAGGAMVIYGHAGTGKSHLFDAMLDTAEHQGFLVAEVDWSGDHALLHIRGNRNSLRPTRRSPTTLRLDQVDRFTDRLRGHPIVLAIDGLDQSPDTLQDSLAGLVHQYVSLEGEPVLVLATARELEVETTDLHPGIRSDLSADTFELGPLDREATILMMRDRGLAGAAATVLGTRLHHEHTGVPGQILEQLDALIEAGWLRAEGDKLLPNRALTGLRTEPFPIPQNVREELTDRLRGLADSEREVVEVLALMDRTISRTLLQRALHSNPQLMMLIENLRRRGLVLTVTESGTTHYRLSHSGASAIIRDDMNVDSRRERHRSLASALRELHRRRSPSAEVGHHLAAAGEHDEAYRVLVQAARRTARSGEHRMTLQHCEAAQNIRDTAHAMMDLEQAIALDRTCATLAGEARLARSEWQDAVHMFERAIDASKNEDPPRMRGRARCGLGQALYHQQQYDDAERELVTGRAESADDTAGRSSATRILADLLLRRGAIGDAEQLWEESLKGARRSRSPEGAARSFRGLAGVRVLQERVGDASELLVRADDLLGPSSDPRLRAGVLSWCATLDRVAGRLGNALTRTDILLDHIDTRHLSERMPAAMALQAEIACAVGDFTVARDAAQKTLLYARTNDDIGWEPRLRVARVLCALDNYDDALTVLPKSIGPRVSSILATPQTQMFALNARACALSDPDRARCLIDEQRNAPTPVLRFAAIAIQTDVAHALHLIGDQQAADVAANTVVTTANFDSSATAGLYLEALLLHHHITADPMSLQQAGEIARSIASRLPPRTTEFFCNRPGIALALASNEEPPE